MTSHAVQIILEILFARHWRYFPLTSAGNTAVLANFGFDHARVLFFVHNGFPCGTNNLRNPICPPLAVFSAKTLSSDQALQSGTQPSKSNLSYSYVNNISFYYIMLEFKCFFLLIYFIV
jgi:hypothetical protein